MIIEDAVEEAIVLFWQKIREIEHPEKPYSWLLHTSENRYQHLRNAHYKIVSISELATILRGNDNFIAATDAESVRQALLKLMPNDHYRTAFVLHEQGFKPTEIAKNMGISLDAAYHVIKRSRERAKQIYMKVLKLCPPPTIIEPNFLKIILKKLELKWRIWKAKWDYTVTLLSMA